MADKKWTAAQQAAIDFGRGNLLVSAAAGSGKTATLTQRIIRLVTDENTNADISRMLVVTFTKAAASELKERIRAELTKALAKDRKNQHLIRQLSDLPRADICTIHSFCLKILKPHFNELGLPPDFHVADEGMCSVLKSDIMRDTVSEYFEDIRNGNASSLVADALGGAKNEAALDKVLANFAKQLSSRGYSAGKLIQYADDLDKATESGFLASRYGRAVRDMILRTTDHYIKIFTDAEEQFPLSEVLTDKYLPAVKECLSTAKKLDEAARIGDYTAIASVISERTPVSLKSVRAEHQTELSLYFKTAREKFARFLSNMGKNYFAMSEEEATGSLKLTANICREAASILDNYFKKYAKAKRDRGVVDFGDLEALACSLLYNEDGSFSQIATELSKKYDYVFIDEYQDTNRIQDKIFTAVSDKCGRFLVGDIKQSIYRFRGAEPEVFAEYRNAWDNENGFGGSSVFMQENFRCDQNVVDFVNIISRYVFRHGSIPFDKNDELVHRKNEDDPKAPPVEVCLILSSKDDDGHDFEDRDDALDDLLDNAPGDVRVNPEAEYVADRIAEMLRFDTTEGGRRLRGSDIAILMRSPGSASAYYIEALERRGIKTNTSASISFFALPEILLALCILNTVENPMRDVYLAGAMRSPVFAFTADELAAIRSYTPDCFLWQAVKRYAEGGEDVFEVLQNKCASFVKKQQELSRACVGLVADKAVDLIFRETSLRELDYGTPNARQNLITLYEMARHYESGIFAGLYGFLAHISELIDNEESTVSSEGIPDPDAVNILSIHHSKGLEYPVCFFSDTARGFNLQDTNSNLIFDNEFGPTMRLPDDTGLIRCDTPVRQAAAAKVHKNTIEEEMRIMYVAMTRARCKLIVTAKMKSPPEFVASILRDKPYLSKESVYGSKNYITWIVGALIEAGIIDTFMTVKGDGIKLEYGIGAENEKEAEEPSQDSSSSTDSEKIAEYREMIDERLNFRYEYEHHRVIPSKLTVSKLTPDVLDGEPVLDEISYSGAIQTNDTVAENAGESSACEKESVAPVPRFLTGDAGYTPAEAGIATHLFMQFCDFTKLKENGAEAELKRLIEQRFISAEIGERVNLYTIEKFLKSSLFSRIENAKDVRREFRFNAAMPAARFTKDPELFSKFTSDGSEVTVQGVIDCVFIDADDKLVLVDYKTDHFPREMLKDQRTLIRYILKKRHTAQLSYYREIAEKMFERPVLETYIYSLALGEAIDIGENQA